jgi:esterase/lipase superfamily enzyme
MPSRIFPAAAAAAAMLALAACQTQLMPTPNIYAGGGYELYGDLDPALQTSRADIMYATDRTPIERKGGSLHYGYGRSRSMAFGSCVVEIGRDVSWETLLHESTSRKRSEGLPLKVGAIRELGRFPQTPVPLIVQDGHRVEDPQVAAQTRDVEKAFREEVRRRLARTPAKDVYMYVHGFHNTFDYAAGVMAEFWHFGGRIGVPLLYSWPAGAPGMLRGYTHDSESGKFTISHLKHLLRLVASIPEVERIHVIAHSRGTGILSNALHELLIEDVSAGRDPRQTLRIANVVLASPDIDIDVFFQRVFGDGFYRVTEHLTVYVSPKDKAIGLSQWLNSDRRMGEIQPEDFIEDEVALLDHIHTYDIVDAKVRAGFLGHSYYHSSPAVSSDLILLLRYGAKAGSDQRPLKNAMSRYWLLDSETYPSAKER